jgi:DNA-binding response OmpR family regulator
LRSSGQELARQLRERDDPALVLIAVTGEDVDVALSPEVQHLDHCLRKPLQLAELAKLPPLPAHAIPGDAGAPRSEIHRHP